jgi:hypothetical protein
MTMTRKAFAAALVELGACQEAQEYVKATKGTPPQLWAKCKHQDWLLWLAGHAGLTDAKPIVLAACDIARSVLVHVPAGEARPEAVIAAAEAYCADPSEANRAAASYAASDAARLAYTAASNAAYYAARAASSAANEADRSASDAAYYAASNAARAASYAANAASEAASSAANEAAGAASNAAYYAASYAASVASDAASNAASAASAAASAASDAASDAAYAASDAARAASYAARAATNAASTAAQQAKNRRLIRKHITWGMVERALTKKKSKGATP